MKKKYIIPALQTAESVMFSSLCVNSPGVTGDTPGGSGPGYGGIDDGTHDPDAKFRDDLTDKEIQMLIETENENGYLW